MCGVPAEVGCFELLAGEGVVVFVDGAAFPEFVQSVEDLSGVLVGFLGFSIFADAADGKIGLVQPDGAAPVAVGGKFGFVGTDSGEGDICGKPIFVF